MRKFKGIRNLFLLITVFVMLLGETTLAFASEGLKIQRYEQKETNIDIVFSGIEDPKEKNLKVMIGNQELPVKKIVSADEYKKGISYVFVVDVSGSVREDQYVFMESIMKSLVKKGNTKNIKIVLVGERVVPFDNATGGNDAMIDKIRDIRNRVDEAGRGETSLYEGIIVSLEEMKKDKKMKLVRNLVVFSDGFEEKSESYTETQVFDKVKESRIPVFTVPVAAGVNLSGDKDSNEILSSFAEISAGGEKTDFRNLSNADSVVDTILSSINNIHVVTVDIKTLKKGSEDRDLKLEYKDESDSIKLSMSKLDLSEQNISSESSVDNKLPEKKSGFPIIIVIIAVAVLIVALLLILIIKNMSSGKVTLMFDMGTGNVKKQMKDKLIIGRDDTKANFAMPNDNRLSSMHCMIYMNNKNLYVKDLDSTNGTYLNGKKVQGSKILSKGDILLIGSMEMKVNWE